MTAETETTTGTELAVDLDPAGFSATDERQDEAASGSAERTGASGPPEIDQFADADLADADLAGAELAQARAEHSIEQQLEALLLVADEPIDAVGLATALDRPVREVRTSLAALQSEYDGGDESLPSRSGRPRGIELREVAGGYRFYVRESLDPIVANFVQQQTPTRLSQAALETLAVIAYRQPISRGAIAAVRAVNVDSVVRTLVGRGLITEVGHDPETGATLYGTDDTLLRHLGLTTLDELPPIAPMLDDPTEGFDDESL